MPAGWALVPPAKGLPTHATLVPEQPGWDDYGYVAGFQLELATLTPKEADARNTAVKRMMEDVHKPDVKLGRIKLTVAGIGPNNDLIKALMVIGEAIYDAYKAAAKAGENVAATVAKATQDIADEINRIPKNLERAPRNIEREVGKGFTRVTGIKGVRIPTAIKKVSKAIAQAAKKTGKTIEEVAKAVAEAKRHLPPVLQPIVPSVPTPSNPTPRPSNLNPDPVSREILRRVLPRW